MVIDIIFCDELTVHVLNILPNERFFLEHDEKNYSYGGYITEGFICPTIGNKLIEPPKRLGWFGATDDHSLHNIHNTYDLSRDNEDEVKVWMEAGNKGCKWYCFNENNTGRRTLKDVIVDGRVFVSPGWNFMVMAGSIIFDWQAGEEGGYFKARRDMLELKGSAKLMLFR